MLLSPDVTWIVTVRDNDGSLTAFDPVCETSFTPTAANLRNGTLAFSNVQSCTSLRLTFVCAAP
jgi:hypothetical protein